MTTTEMKTEILRILGLPLEGDPDLTDEILLQYLRDAHNQLAEDTFCYRRQVIVPTVKSSKKIIACTFSSAPSEGSTFTVGSTVYTFSSSITGAYRVLNNDNYIQNLSNAINGTGQGTTCSTDVIGYQMFISSYASNVLTLTGITYDTTLNSTTVTCSLVTQVITNGVDGITYTLPVDVIKIDRVTYGGYELIQSNILKENIYEISPGFYNRYSVDKIIIDGYNAGQYPLILDCYVTPSSVTGGIPLLPLSSPPSANDIPYGIPEMFHRILVYISSARIMTEMFADTVDGAQIRIQTSLNMANLLTNKFKAALIAW